METLLSNISGGNQVMTLAISMVGVLVFIVANRIFNKSSDRAIERRQ